ncbi:hypothetical protein [Cohaesibacter haloalkalitolerans]|uniref:hypothetical protein n=1 Tax=Cohaesibacter haloalkalitolerans TaxID=1162980 RepID=UPI000E6465F4|nr:hypothetical protein [Cohaesibacter haloalkalitolerans]
MQVNELTGEVSVTLDGKGFVLHATLPRVAALMAELQITGLRQLHFMAAVHDPRLTYSGLKCLCASGNSAAADGMLFGKVSEEAEGAVIAALAAGMPEKSRQPGKPQQPGETEATASPGDA